MDQNQDQNLEYGADNEQSAKIRTAMASAIQQKERGHMDALQDSLSAQADKHAKMIKVASIKAAVPPTF